MPACRRPTTTARRASTDTPPGFLRSMSNKPKPLTDELSVRQLSDRHAHNARTLASQKNSSGNSDRAKLLTAEQVEIEKRIVEINNQREVDSITFGVGNTSISAFETMQIDNHDPPGVKPIGAKQRALRKFDERAGGMNMQMLAPQLACEIESARHKYDEERRQQRELLRGVKALQLENEKRSKEEVELLLTEFMNHKPSDSDMDSDEDSDDNPANWFHDEQGDGRKGQQIIEPDQEDYSSVIRIDESKAYQGYGTFYEPRDDGD